MSFNRTISGLIAKSQFYSIPTIWIEGISDIPFYEKISINRECRFDEAGGKPECLKLAQELIDNNLPYIVIMDGDYDILERKRNPHKRVIYLQKYSIENYLFEKEAINIICCNLIRKSTPDKSINKNYADLLNSIETSLFNLLTLDLAHFRKGTGRKILPARVESLFESGKTYVFSKKQINLLIKKFPKALPNKEIRITIALIRKFNKANRFFDLLPGHFAFGIIRRFIFINVKRIKHRNPNIDNDSLLALLSAEVWNHPASKDHINLRRRITEALRNLNKMQTK